MNAAMQQFRTLLICLNIVNYGKHAPHRRSPILWHKSLPALGFRPFSVLRTALYPRNKSVPSTA